MSAFVWTGTDRKGQKIKGEISSLNVAAAKAELRKQGVTAKSVRKKPKPLFGGKKKITPLDISIFSRQLATMMKAGVPLVQSFDIVAEGLDNLSMKELVINIKNEVEGGNSLAGALRKHPLYFDDLFCSLVDSGEQSGALETMLDRIATYKEKTEALKAKIKKAVKYPIAVVVVAVIVTTILLLKVVPTFEELFNGFGAELPAFTQMVIGMSRWMQDNWYIFLGAIGGSVFGFSEAKRRSQRFSDALDALSLKMPVVGNIIYQSTIARYARTLATTFAAGVPLVEALDSVAGATGNVIYRNAVLKIKEEVSSGTQMNFSMKSTGLFPSMAVQMTAIGEESGSLDAMLDKVATHYEQEVDAAVDGLTSLLEPIIMAVLGVIVGGLIIAMYLPIFQLGNAV
ncbi:Type IV fimbrial biogenesis membrane protein, involved in pilus assembly [gamma proteobacterium HdN1]|nr:Type IV fimbrial biogenesis membrane protein, involved in pilus assembly [gamma proteobacterium HdN1]